MNTARTWDNVKPQAQGHYVIRFSPHYRRVFYNFLFTQFPKGELVFRTTFVENESSDRLKIFSYFGYIHDAYG